MNNNIQDILKEMISFHGFSSNTNTGFSCYIPDPKPFSPKEGLLLWVCTPKGEKIITKIQLLVSKLRQKRLKNLNFLISEQEFSEQLIPIIIDYSNKLDQLGFKKISNGVTKNIKSKIFNKSLALSEFDNNLKLLREFERYLISNPITLFAEEKGYFTVKEKNKIFV